MALGVKFDRGEGQTLSLKVNVPAEAVKGAKTARVRVGMLAGRDGDKLLMKAGGQEYRLLSAWYQDIPLKKLPRAGENILTFKLVKRGLPEKRPTVLRISSAVIAVEK